MTGNINLLCFWVGVVVYGRAFRNLLGYMQMGFLTMKNRGAFPSVSLGQWFLSLWFTCILAAHLCGRLYLPVSSFFGLPMVFHPYPGGVCKICMKLKLKPTWGHNLLNHLNCHLFDFTPPYIYCHFCYLFCHHHHHHTLATATPTGTCYTATTSPLPPYRHHQRCAVQGFQSRFNAGSILARWLKFSMRFNPSKNWQAQSGFVLIISFEVTFIKRGSCSWILL